MNNAELYLLITDYANQSVIVIVGYKSILIAIFIDAVKLLFHITAHSAKY